MKRPLIVSPYSRPYATGPGFAAAGPGSAAHVVRYKNGRANLKATFASMAKGEVLLIRMTHKADRTRIQGAANNAKTRIRIEEHPEKNALRVTSLGPQRERVMSETIPGRVRYFKARLRETTEVAKKVKQIQGLFS